MNSLPIVLGILSVSVLLVAAQIPQRCGTIYMKLEKEHNLELIEYY